MAHYIDATKINVTYKDGDFYYDDKVSNLPVIDGAPLKHSKWRIQGKYRSCAHCGQFIENSIINVQYWKYCPFCGAIMDLK